MDYRPLAKIFTSASFSKVAKGDLREVITIITNYPCLNNLINLQEIYNEAYKLLSKYYPNEYVIKNIIANNILIGTHSMNTASMLSELRVGANKADCVIINGISTCYEIKTKFDSLKRLSNQLNCYTQIFDRTYVVTHEHHFKSLLKIYTENPTFGIIISNDRNRLSKKVIAPLIDSFDLEVTFHTLRKHEYLDIIKDVTGEVPEFPDTEIFRECKKVFCQLNPQEANEQFKRVLKKYRHNDDVFINKLPKSMKNLGISFKFNERDKSSITSSLSKSHLLNKDVENVLPLYERKTL